jgi:hypothetical protein
VGNFYTSITLRGASADRVVQVMTDLGRDAYVFSDDRTVVVYDRESEEQDTEVLAALAERLATETSCVAFAVLDHDDDVLWFQLYDRDELVAEYCNRIGPRPRARAMARALGCASAWLKLWFVLRRPYVTQIYRHIAINDIAGFPEATILGYRYIDRGERTDDMAAGKLVKLPRWRES